jgi:N-acyl amino acid synthase of PEP-CTERM/exosortase system
MAGTVRLILPDTEKPEQSFPMQCVCHEPIMKDPERFPVSTMGEVSRFSISKHFRRRQTDTAYPDTLDEQGEEILSKSEIRQIMPHITLGLIEGLVRMSVENGVTYWCAAMERQLLRLLTRIGIYFDNIGPPVDHHGIRQPCYRNLPELLDRVKEERFDVWEVITNNGAHVKRLGAYSGRT